MVRTIILSLFILVSALSGSAYCSDLFSHKWDFDFRQSAKRYLPGVDWKLLKAQCYQESRLLPDAVSPVGAQGLCQFMPYTWADVEKRLKFPPEASAFSPELSIEAAGFYMGSQLRIWSAPRPFRDRYDLSLASYNAGAGHLINAQKRCGGPNLYPDIIKCLPMITGRHSKETIGYVRLIRKFHIRLQMGGF